MISRTFKKRLIPATIGFGFAVCVVAPAMADDKKHDMDLVGTNDLQARSTYQPTVNKQGGRYILYAGHHPLGTNPVTGSPLPSFNPITGVNEPNGTSLVDVTDPKHPKYLAHIPVGASGSGGAQMVWVCKGRALPVHNDRVYMLRSYSNSAHEIWDTTDPSHPVGVRTVAGGNPVIGGLAGTHKSWWECDTGIAYVVGRRSTDTAAGWKSGNHIMIFDLSHPGTPLPTDFKRDWALHGQEPGAPIPFPFTAATGVPSIHGPISTGPSGGPVELAGATGNRVYFAYGTSSNGTMQIVDRALLLSTPANDFQTAEVGRWVMNEVNGAHTSFPLGKIAIPDFAPNAVGTVRDFVAVTSEETFNECTGPRNLTYMVDVTSGSRPQSQANFQVPEEDAKSCDVGGRFGPHSTQEEFGPPFYQKIIFVAYFNAGVRAVDVRDPFNPAEVAFYIPKTTANTDYRCKTADPATCKIAIQTNNVATDDRGYVYIVDRADTGLHVLRLKGQAAKIAGLKDKD